MEPKTVATKEVPAAIGPYSQAILYNNFFFTSGQIALDAATGDMVAGGIAEQTRQVLKNLSALLQAAGLTLQHVIKTTIFLKDMNDFSTVNTIYASYFGEHKPVRSTIEVNRLPKDALIEIDCIAYQA